MAYAPQQQGGGGRAQQRAQLEVPTRPERVLLQRAEVIAEWDAPRGEMDEP